MDTNIFRGNAVAVAQVNTETPANVEIGDVFSLTLSDDLAQSHEITYTAAAATVKDAVEGLKASADAAKAAGYGPWDEITATEDDAILTLTSDTAGKPFTVVATATNGGANDTQTLTDAASVANSGPADYKTAANWSLATVPVATDIVIIAATATAGILYGLDQHTVGLTSFAVERGVGPIGSAAAPLRIVAADVHFDSAGDAFIEANTVTGAFNVTYCGTSSAVGTYPLNVTGATIAAFNFSPEDSGCRAALAGQAGETATATTVRVSSGSLKIGAGVTMTTLLRTGGDVDTSCPIAAATENGDGTHVHKAGALGAATLYGGKLDYRSIGTLTALIVSGDAEATFAADPRPKTVSACDLYSGAALRDPNKVVTWTAGIDLNECGLDDVTLDVGNHARLTLGAPA